MLKHKKGTVVQTAQHCKSGLVLGTAEILGTYDKGLCYIAELISSDSDDCQDGSKFHLHEREITKVVSRRYTAGVQFGCPHCMKKQDDQVDDYTSPGAIGIPFTDSCGWCDKPFTVERTIGGAFDIKGV